LGELKSYEATVKFIPDLYAPPLFRERERESYPICAVTKTILVQGMINRHIYTKEKKLVSISASPGTYSHQDEERR
jgi:hypothetical protein